MILLRAPLLLALAPGLLLQAAAASAQVDGRERIAALGCAACHPSMAPAGLRAAPDLQLAAGRIRDEALERFLAAPHDVQPDTRMPDVLGSLGADQRARAAESLALFLRSVAAPTGPIDREVSAERGERLYHEVGCVMCHGARVPEATESARRLDHVAAKWTIDGLAAFLHAPLDHRPAGLMPDMHLSRQEAADLAAYLAPPRVEKTAGPTSIDDARAAEGRALFTELRCANCHGGVDGIEPRPVPEAPRPASRGCASAEPPAGAPTYVLEEDERAAIELALTGLETRRSPADEVAATFGAFRCTACHQRGDAGGVPQSLDAYLLTDEPDLGEPARRPPILDGVGGKLRRTWLERVLYDGASVRPYMRTRMPIFGESNLAHLPGLLEEVDAAEPLTFPKPEGDADRESRDAAQLLLGTQRLACVTCHSFNAKDGPGFQGIDLVTTTERLRERWFRDFLVAPQAHIPDIVMPESWPGGEAVDDETLGGDTDRQIGAIWHFLTLGRTAPNPRGIDQPRWDVDVGGRPRVYRGRSRVAGFRGVAVGFPEGLHYAFDANSGALAAIWRGDFVSVNWNGQGAGDFNPRARAAELARDVALLERVDGDTPWPLQPVKTKEEPVNPDPQYPRQHGYRFRGYRLDAGGVPTLRYALRDVAVDDRSTPVERDGRLVLVRTLTFEAMEPAQLTFRALVGDVDDRGEGRFRAGRIALNVGALEARLRPLAESQELLLDLDLPAGRTSLELIYDLAD